MPVRLTDAAIGKVARAAEAVGVRRDLADAACPGLRVRVSPSGAKAWVLACRDREGRMRRFPLGAYPAVGIGEARERARALHVDVRQNGADPNAERKRARAAGRDAKAGVGTLAAILGAYERREAARLKRWPECRRRIESVFGAVLDRPLAALAVTDLRLAADEWPSRQSAAAAVRYVRPVLKWASGLGYAPVDLAAIKPPATVLRRDRVLSRDELARLLPVLAASARPHAAVMRFLLLTLARLNEATAACWRDVDLRAGTWTIPETKNGQPHVVPLSRQAVALLAALRPGRPASGALVFAAAGNWDRETKRLQAASGVAGWTRHDLRRTGATMLGDMGETPDIIEAALNHVAIRSQLAATYNRSRYRPQVAAALQRLADAYDGIAVGGADVVPLRRSSGA